MIQQSEVLRRFLTMADSSFDETDDNNPVIFDNGSKARLLMNINEHAKYYKSLSLIFLLLFFPRERLVASPTWGFPTFQPILQYILPDNTTYKILYPTTRTILFGAKNYVYHMITHHIIAYETMLLRRMFSE